MFGARPTGAHLFFVLHFIFANRCLMLTSREAVCLCTRKAALRRLIIFINLVAFNPCHYFMTGYSVTVPVMLRRNGLIQVDV